MRESTVLAVVACLALPCLASLRGAPAGPAAAEDPAAPRNAWVEIPGVQEWSGRLIARPVPSAVRRSRGETVAEAGEQARRARVELRRYETVRYVPQTDETILRVPPGATEVQVAEELLATGLFEYVVPDWRVFPSALPAPQHHTTSQNPLVPPIGGQGMSRCPDDPLFASQWHHQDGILNSCQAWGTETGSPTIAVGVCDTGIRTTHQDLLLHRLEGYNAVDHLWESEGGDIGPKYYHGTRTTGVVAANGDNGVGVSGVGWNLSHRMLRVSNASDGSAYLSDLQHGARTSIEAGDRIANVSYHGATSFSNLPTATYIRSLGGLLLWSAGNSGGPMNQSDRDADDLLVIGATTQTDTLATFSNYGRFMDLVAPGVGIASTDSGNDADYATADGTSYSCPMTSGVCAMIWSQRPTLSPTDVVRILEASCVDLGTPGVDDTFGHGRIDLAAALATDGSAVPQAALASPSPTGASPLTVPFTDLSSGVPTAWLWDFGDGNQSTAQNPVHVYTTTGTYTVTLTVTNQLGQDTATLTDYVLVDVIPPVADFSADPTGGLAPLAVQFTDDSGGGPPSTWFWDFGDGDTSTEEHPSHVYTTSGFFDVTLQVANAYGSDTLTKTSYIAVDYIPPVADFVGAPTSGNSPLVVQFTDLSGGGDVTTWSWNFGDGYGSALQHPAHTYTVPGTYSVSLTASNPYGSDQLVRSGYVVVGDGPPIVAEFSGTPLTGQAPLTVTFTDESIGHVIGWTWEFDDGTSSTEQNPVHVFTAPGQYNVALEVYDANGSDSAIEKDAYIVVQ